MLDRYVGCQKGVDDFWIVSITSLPHKYSRDALAPELFDCCQDAQLVIYKNVTFGWITSLDVIEGASIGLERRLVPAVSDRLGVNAAHRALN